MHLSVHGSKKRCRPSAIATKLSLRLDCAQKRLERVALLGEGCGALSFKAAFCRRDVRAPFAWAPENP